MMLDVCIGWDPRDDLAYKVCEASLRHHSTIPLNIIPLKDHELRRRGLYTRPKITAASGQYIDAIEGRPFSTDFAFTRFLSPHLATSEWLLFCDADFMWRADVADLLTYANNQQYSVRVVKHEHNPVQTVKMDGVSQGQYHRKNWSSLMLINKSSWGLGVDEVSYWPGASLHAFRWLEDYRIGSLPEEWNWLEGHSNQRINPKAVHFTRGTPDMIEGTQYEQEWNQWRRQITHT